MAKSPRRQGLEPDVVLNVRCRHHNRSWPGELEYHALEGRESRRVQMLDDLDHRCCIEPRQPVVAIHQRSVNESDPVTLPLRKTIEIESIRSVLKRTNGHIHADDLLESRISKKIAKQVAFATAKVQHALRAGFAQRRPNSPKALLVQRQGALDLRLLLREN